MASQATRRRGVWERDVRLGIAVYLSVAMMGGLGLSSPAAQAAMHDAETCRRVKTELDQLSSAGIRDMMAKGPEWAKTNLTKERLDQVRRFLTLEEDIRFRCPLGKARPELEAAESEAGAITPLQPGEQAPAAKTPPAPAGKPARKPKAQSSAANTSQVNAQANAPGSGPVNGGQAGGGQGETATEPARKKPR